MFNTFKDHLRVAQKKLLDFTNTGQSRGECVRVRGQGVLLLLVRYLQVGVLPPSKPQPIQGPGRTPHKCTWW